MTDRYTTLKSLLGQPTKPSCGSADLEKLSVCLADIWQEVEGCKDHASRNALRVSVMPDPLRGHGQGACDCCGRPFEADSLAEQSTVIQIVPLRVKSSAPAASAHFCLDCAARFGFSSKRLAAWFLAKVFGNDISKLIELSPKTLLVGREVDTWNRRNAARRAKREGRS